MPSRYQREIEDILEKAGEEGPAKRRPRRSSDRRSFRKLVWLYVRQSLSGNLFSISPGRIMLFGFVLLLSFLLVRPFSAGVAGMLAWAGLIIFIIGYALVLVRPPKIEKRWRGQSVEMDSPGGSWLDRIRRKITRS